MACDTEAMRCRVSSHGATDGAPAAGGPGADTRPEPLGAPARQTPRDPRQQFPRFHAPAPGTYDSPRTQTHRATGFKGARRLLWKATWKQNAGVAMSKGQAASETSCL